MWVIVSAEGANPGRMAPMSLQALATGRRRELLDAALAVVADGGLRALTHRAVDAAAGVPQGSTSGYFRTRLALLTGLTEHVSRLLVDTIAGLRDVVASIAADVDPAVGACDPRIVDAVAELLVDLTADSRLVRVQAELGIESMRTPELAEVFDISRREFVALVAEIAERVNPDIAAERADTSAAAFQGVLLAAGLQPPALRGEWVTAATRQLIAALAADPDPGAGPLPISSGATKA